MTLTNTEAAAASETSKLVYLLGAKKIEIKFDFNFKKIMKSSLMSVKNEIKFEVNEKRLKSSLMSRRKRLKPSLMSIKKEIRTKFDVKK